MVSTSLEPREHVFLCNINIIWKPKNFGDVKLCVKKGRALQTEEAESERQAKTERERQRHTAGRWRSLRAPGQPCDGDSGEHNPKSPWNVLIVMRRWKGCFGNGGRGSRRERGGRQKEERSKEISRCTEKRERVANEK